MLQKIETFKMRATLL